MSENSTLVDVVEGALDSLNTTLNGTASTPHNAPETIWGMLQDLDFLLLEAKLVFSAIGIIYVASHAALRRPPSAAKPKPKKGAAKHDDEEEDNFAQGLELSDAIMFPIMAGFMLVGLYYLIQWLQDPEILNKILRWYMSTMSIVSLLTLFAHAFEVGTSFVFPNYWRGRDGRLRKVEQGTRTVKLCDDVGNVTQGHDSQHSTGPLPGFLSVLAFSDKTKKLAWDLRGLVTQQWILKFYAHGMGHANTKIKLSHIFALFAALATTLLYNSTSSPFLSNVLGYGLCYGSLMLISPTNLAIGSLVLVGLFFYDIVMVFYTFVASPFVYSWDLILTFFLD